MKELEKIVDSNGEPLEIVDAEARADISEIKQSLSDFEILEKTASGDIVSFNDGSDLPMPKLEVAIEPVQSGSGDPSPTNVRPISGWDKVNVTVADDVETPTLSNVYTIDLDGTRYGGTLDVVSGVLTVDRVNLLLNGLTYTKNSRVTSVGGSYFRAVIPQKAISDTDNTQLYSHGISNNAYYSKTNCARAFESTSWVFVGFTDEMGIDTLEKFNQWLADNSSASICYKIKDPITIQLTPTQVKSLLGVNNIWADTGNIELTYLTNNPLTQTVYDMVKILVEQST